MRAISRRRSDKAVPDGMIHIGAYERSRRSSSWPQSSRLPSQILLHTVNTKNRLLKLPGIEVGARKYQA